MRVMFVADIHIKLGQRNVPIEWALNRYELFHKKLSELQNNVDIVILGGDVFDKVPSLDEMNVYYNLIKTFKKETFIIPGNHEALKKDTTFFSKLKDVSNIINDNICIIDDYYTKYGIDFIPYNKLKEFNADNFSNKILVTHVRGAIPPHVKPEIPLEKFARWDVVLAGDLHSYDNCQENILYPGSPMSITFHRNPISNGIIIFDTETLEHEWIDLKLPQLIRKTITAGEDMPSTDFDHTIYEVEGNLAELQELKDVKLLDKKITKRNNDMALILDSSMTLTDELTEYLKYILMLEDGAVSDILTEFKTLEAKLND